MSDTDLWTQELAQAVYFAQAYKLWRPTSVDGCTFWVRANQFTTLSDGVVLNALKDQSGAENDMTKSGDPTYAVNVINNLPAMRFDGNDYFQTWPNPPIQTSLEWSIFMVVRANQTNDYANLFSNGDANATGYDLWFQNNGKYVIAYRGIGAYATTESYNTDWHLLTFMRQLGGRAILRRNSVGLTVTTPTTSPNTPDTATAIMNSLIGSLAEIFAFNHFLAEDDRDDAETYLRSKYAL